MTAKSLLTKMYSLILGIYSKKTKDEAYIGPTVTSPFLDGFSDKESIAEMYDELSTSEYGYNDEDPEIKARAKIDLRRDFNYVNSLKKSLFSMYVSGTDHHPKTDVDYFRNMYLGSNYSKDRIHDYKDFIDGQE